MKRIVSFAILIRMVILSFLLMKFGIETAAFYGIFAISVDVIQIKLDIEEIKNREEFNDD